jgi:hypothetical protein
MLPVALPAQTRGLRGINWDTAMSFEDGHRLFEAVCDIGLEGVLAKALDSATDPASGYGSSARTGTTPRQHPAIGFLSLKDLTDRRWVPCR